MVIYVFSSRCDRNHRAETLTTPAVNRRVNWTVNYACACTSSRALVPSTHTIVNDGDFDFLPASVGIS